MAIVWIVYNNRTGELLHADRFYPSGLPKTSSLEMFEWWEARDEAQARAQAAFLGDEWQPACMPLHTTQE